MKALGRTHIDFFSLDVEGAELGVLKTIPFHELIIDVLLVEYLVPGNPIGTRTRFNDYFNFMTKNGRYEYIGSLKNLDMIFVRRKKFKDKLLNMTQMLKKH